MILFSSLCTRNQKNMAKSKKTAKSKNIVPREPRVATTYDAVWSYETGHGPRTVRHEFTTKLKKGFDIAAAKRSFKYFAKKQHVDKHLHLHDLVITSVEGMPVEGPNRPIAGGVFVIEFKILYEYEGYQGRETVIREGVTGVMQSMPILKNRREVDAHVAEKLQEWRDAVESGEIKLPNTADKLTDTPLEAIELSVTQVDPDRIDAEEARSYVRNMRMKKSAPEKIFTFRTNDAKETVSVQLEDVCVLEYLVNVGQNWAEKSNGVNRSQGWKRGYPRTVPDMAEWFKLENASDGVSINMLIPFCERFSYNLYAFDCLGRKVATYKVADNNAENEPPPKRSKAAHSPSLVFWIKDEHVYPVTDQGFKLSLMRTDSHRPPRQKYKEADIKAIDPSSAEVTELLQDQSAHGLVLMSDSGKESGLEKIYELIVNETSVHPMVELSASGVSSLRTDRLEVRLCEEPARAQTTATRLGVDYHGQSITAIGMDFLSQIRGKFESSVYSAEVAEVVASREFYRSQVNIGTESLCECGVPLNNCMLHVFETAGHGDSNRLRLPSMNILKGELDETLLTTVDINNNCPTNAADMPPVLLCLPLVMKLRCILWRCLRQTKPENKRSTMRPPPLANRHRVSFTVKRRQQAESVRSGMEMDITTLKW
ncbi:hypothetical protein DFS34DRAFT_489811 [Phlyctochytrium arcticum]|nr:hypothetical protein DFS34DRAFT_489811 [Phlyctochytrium arcticum]